MSPSPASTPPTPEGSAQPAAKSLHETAAPHDWRLPAGIAAALLLIGLIIALAWWLWFRPISGSASGEQQLAQELGRQAELRESLQKAQPDNPADCPAGQSLRPATSAAQAPPLPETGEATQLTDAQLTAKLEAASAIVLVSTRKDGLGTGTGFFVRQDLILTNRHVVEESSKPEVLVTSRALGAVRKATIVGATRHSEAGSPDFALLQLEQPAPSSVVPLDFSPQSPKLTPVVAAGYPGLVTMADASFGRLMKGDLTAAPDLNLTKGAVQSLQEGTKGTPLLIHTANISGGNSGGPLVDHCARVLGVNTFLLLDNEQSSKAQYAIRSSAALDFLKALEAPGRQDNRPCGKPG
ncbi:MAG: S1 family peptidase [Burkholderiaceae bacterium]